MAFEPLISTPLDHVAPPSVDWLNTIGLFAPTPAPVQALNRVQVTYTSSALGLPTVASATMNSLSLAMHAPLFSATIPSGLSRYSWNVPGAGECQNAPPMPAFDLATSTPFALKSTSNRTPTM